MRSRGRVARLWRAEGGSTVVPGDICLRSRRREPRGRARAGRPESEPCGHGLRGPQSHPGTAVRLPGACGYTVDNCRHAAREPVGIRVDRMALIVRNPNERDRKEAIVENRGKIIRTCSLRYFLLQMKVDCSLHNPAVLTGTTTVLEFSRRWRRRKQ